MAKDRHLHHIKAFRTTTGTGHPKPNQGADGDMTIRTMEGGLFLFVKYGNIWYGVSELEPHNPSSGARLRRFSPKGGKGGAAVGVEGAAGNIGVKSGSKIILDTQSTRSGTRRGKNYMQAVSASDIAIVSGGVKSFQLDNTHLEIGTNRRLSLADNEIDVSSGNLTLDVAGSIISDSNTGVFIAKRAGTEFSAANSAYAGMILGYTAIGIDATTASYDVTNAFVTIGSGHKVTFVGPPSGNVEIMVSCFNDAGVGRPLFLGLSDNATYNTLDVTHEHEVSTSGTNEFQINHYWTITGLTAGTSYTYYIGAKCSHNSALVLRWGGDATAEYGPFIIKATALPATIYDGS